MYHQQWLENVQSLLGEIKASYPDGTSQEQSKHKKRLQQIKQSCDELLHAWAVIEDEIGKLAKQYPELLEEDDAVEEEFEMDESMVSKFRQGQGYYQLTMFEQAIPLFDQLMQNEPDFLLGRVYLGLCYFKQNEFAAARQQFRIVIDTAKAEDFIGFAYLMLGCVHVQEKDDQLASKQFAQAVKILPQNSDAWFNLAACLYRLKQYQEAIPYFFQALSINGDDWEAMFYISKCYHHSRQYESVSFWRIQAYEKMNHPRMIQAIAQDFEENHQYEEALNWYQRLHTQDRKNCFAYQGLAWNTWALGKTAQAICWLKKGLSLYPKDPYLLFFHFWILLQQGKTTQAEKVTKILPNCVREDPVWFALQSRFFTQIGDYRHALDVAEQLITQDKHEIAALGYYQKGKILLEMEQISEAVENFQHARKRIKGWKDPIFFEGICYLVQKQPNQTRACWEQIDLLL